MSRLPGVSREDLDEEGRALYDRLASFNASIGNALVGHPLEPTSGPAGAFLQAPELGRLVLDLGAHVSTSSSLPPRTKEIVVMTVVAHWRSEFEWWAHARMAPRHGIDASLLDAIEAGGPAALADDERVLRDLTRQMLTTGRIDGATHQAARAQIGDRGLVELLSLCGYYTLIAFLLNGFDVGVPAGEASTWAER
jgi:4-carboxymuconolactone decarboxylase